MPAAGIDDAADGEIKSFRASVLAKPVERLELKLLYLRNETQQNGSSLLVNLDPPLSTGSVGDFASSDFDLFSGTISYEFDFATLSTASSYIDFGRGLQVGFPFPVPGGLLIQKQDTAAHAFNNETRLVSNGSGPLQWLTGLYYADSSNKGTGSLDPPLVPSSTSTADSESISIFGEVSYALFDGKLIPLVGLRYFKDERATDNLVSPDPPDRATFDSINPRFNLTFKPTPNSLYYLNVAKGFRSGQFNDPVSCQDLHRAQGGLPCENAVDSDELWSYEIGSKQDLADRQVQVEAAIYFQDWKDIQQSLQYDNIGQTYQFGDARLYGIDFGLVFAPAGISGLRFETSGNWNSSTYSNIDPVLTAAAAAGGIKDGDRIPLVPDWTLSASASYQWNFPGGGWEGNALIGYNHIAPQLGRPGAVIGKGDARDLLRARIGVRRGGLGIALFGSNLLNENGAIYVAAAGDSSTFTQDYPRQIGIEVTVDGF
jgi:outer membrane receptor protein involved in Fe transport